MDDFYHFLYESRPHQQIKLGLERIFTLSRKLGHPERRYRSIHIAGTNGKGSVTKMISSLLVSSGFNVGANYSPHLVSFNERITLNDRPITDEQLLHVLNAIYPAIEEMDNGEQKMKPSFFEIVTAMAFYFFREEAVDFASVEVGMGGRLDASNIIRPEVCAITSIGFDHMKSLGNSIGKIAYEKAGIIKKHVPIVCGALPEEARGEIASRARLLESEAFFIGNDYSYYPQKSTLNDNLFSYDEEGYTLSNIPLRLNGRHQLLNASTAICCYRRLCQRLSLPYNEETVRKVMAQITWPGRFEVICDTPSIIIDGAHNPPAFETLVKAWKEYFGEQKAVLITGILADKEYPKMVDIIKPIISKVIITEPKAGERVQIGPVCDTFKEKCPGAETEFIRDYKEVCVRALSVSGNKTPILVTGSLYLVGYIKDTFRTLFTDKRSET
jgi:dihydrofolate synthase/folylpolyglutamate synthase